MEKLKVGPRGRKNATSRAKHEADRKEKMKHLRDGGYHRQIGGEYTPSNDFQ